MAVAYKCKMCGGELSIDEGSNVTVCEYCGTTQTVPTADNEKKMTLFGRANRLLRACEFDKAAGVFESVVAEFPEEAEAYWGLVLCKYGIEYVDDPATGKKIPTCHRSSFDSVLEDNDFEQAQENSDAVARKVYREEAKAIETLRRNVIEISGKEEPYDIFICYKETTSDGSRTLDSVLAQDIYDALTEKGYRVFFSRVTLEDKLGQEYEPYIFAALNSARIMLAIGTDFENYNAVWVKNEWSRFLKLIASGQKKVLIPCFKNLDPYDMPKEFARLQSQDLGKVGAMQDLLRGIDKILEGKEEPSSQQIMVQQTGPNVSSLLERGNIELEDENWEKAKELFDQVLSQEPKCADAYIGLFMKEHKLHNWNEFEDFYIASIDRFADDRQLRRAHQYCCDGSLDELDKAWKRKYEQDAAKLAPIRKRLEAANGMIAAGCHCVMGIGLNCVRDLQQDSGVMVIKTDNAEDCGQFKVAGWWDIVAVATSGYHTVGLKSDGRVIAVGRNEEHQCDVSDWRDIVAMSVNPYYTRYRRAYGPVRQVEVSVNEEGGSFHTVGLKSDGRVVAVGSNSCGQCDVSDWRDIVAVSAGDRYTVGLKSDGRVVAVGSNGNGRCDVSEWRNIVSISAGDLHTVGLMENGRVVATGENEDHQCDVSEWKDIVAVSTRKNRTIGLKADGTVVVTSTSGGSFVVSGWTDIVAIDGSGDYMVGLKANGTVVADGKIFKEGVTSWKLFNSLDTLEQERKNAHNLDILEKRRQEDECRRMEAEELERKRLEEERRQTEAEQQRRNALEQEREELQKELAHLKGLFTGKQRKRIETRLADIEKLLDKKE